MAVVRHAPRLVTDDMPALREAAYAGIGVVQLSMMMIWEDLAAGRLLEVAPGWHPPAGIVHATFASRRGLLPSVRALLDFLVRECAAQRQHANRSLARGETLSITSG
jgi:DNA-binding transcriptional LysR family regulator